MKKKKIYFETKTGQKGYEFTYQKGPQQMENLLHVDKVNFFCKNISLYTTTNLCVVIEICASEFPYGLRMMSKNTLYEPEPDSAS